MFSRNSSGGSTKTKRNLSQDIRTPDKNSNPQTSECKSAASPLESECKELTVRLLMSHIYVYIYIYMELLVKPEMLTCSEAANLRIM